MIFTIDYGHCLSGSDTGAQGNGRREQDCTREIGVLVVNKLRQLGHTAHEIRVDSASSVSNSLNTRVNQINSIKPDLSVSIHLNAGGGTGSEIYTDGYSNSYATNILTALNGLGLPNRGIKNGSNFALVNSVTSHAMLVEVCFIDSASDMAKYNADKLATAIVKGLTGQSTSTPNPTPSQPQPSKEYLNLHSHVGSWRIYNVNGPYTTANAIGSLAPKQYGGLSYEIIGKKQTDVYVIKTSSFGNVAIYAPKNDPDCSFSSSPKYGATSTPSNPGPTTTQKNGTAKVLVSVLNVRSNCSVNSSVVAEYYYGETINYSAVINNEGYTWIKYVSGSGHTRYVAAKHNSSGEKYLSGF